jgi:hypothetical protein
MLPYRVPCFGVDAVLAQLLIEWIAIVGAIAD